MHRREVLRGVTYTSLAVGIGSGMPEARAQSPDAVDADSYEALDSDRFPTVVPISWITDRYVQIPSEDAPVVGHTVETTAIVLEQISSPDEHGILREQFDWDNIDYTEHDAFAALFSAVSWPLEQSISSDFFDAHDLLWIAGIDRNYYRDELWGLETAASTDQEFYELYGHTPFIFAAIDSVESPPPGTVVDFSATIQHTGDGEGPITDGDGGYLDIQTLTTRERIRTPDGEWETNQPAAFTGIQYHPSPELSTSVTAVQYEDDLPRPQGGSVLAKSGNVAATGTPAAGSVTEHELDSDAHEMLVGDFLPVSWEDDRDEDDWASDPVNISLVVDTSGSMSARDTGWYHDDGTEKTRLEVAQESAKMFLDFLEDSHTVSVVEFNSSASVVSGAVELDEMTREAFKQDVDRLSDGGRTTIGGGMEVGHDTIRDRTGPKTLLLLSDGEENTSPMVADVLPELRNQGVRVYTIGMGAEIDEDQLEFIADQTGAESLWDHDPGEVRDFFGEFGIDTQQRARTTRTRATVREGDVVEDDCRVDASCEDVQFVMSYEGSNMSLVVMDPDGNEITEGAGVSHRVGAAHEVWTIDDPPTGEWEYRIEVHQVDAPQTAQAQVSSDSPIDTELFVSDDLYEQTGFIRFQLKVESGLSRYTGAEAYLEVTPPGQEAQSERIQLHDDGGGADDVSDDGIYSSYYHPTATGEYEFTAIVEGGEFPNLQRESQHSATIETVIENPIRPFAERDDSFLSTPLIIGGIITGLAAAYYYFEHKQDDDGDATAVSGRQSESLDTPSGGHEPQYHPGAHPASPVPGPDERNRLDDDSQGEQETAGVDTHPPPEQDSATSEGQSNQREPSGEDRSSPPQTEEKPRADEPSTDDQQHGRESRTDSERDQ